MTNWITAPGVRWWFNAGTDPEYRGNWRSTGDKQLVPSAGASVEENNYGSCSKNFKITVEEGKAWDNKIYFI